MEMGRRLVGREGTESFLKPGQPELPP
jgi:hypothetical protein